MRAIAKYIGKTEKLGVKPGEIHLVDLNTYQNEHGAPYLWVLALDCDEYLMPFVSVDAVLHSWAFIEDDGEAEREQDKLEDEWFETYYPGGAVQ